MAHNISFGKYRLVSLHWRHNDHDRVSNHQPHGCLLNRLFRRRSKKALELRVTGLCVGNSQGPANSPHKGPVTRKMFQFDDVIMSASMTSCRTIRQLPSSYRFGHSVIKTNYRKTSSINRTKSQNLNVSCLLLQWSLPNPLKPGVKMRMKMLLEQRRQAMLQLHLSYQQFYCLLRCDLC